VSVEDDLQHAIGVLDERLRKQVLEVYQRIGDELEAGKQAALGGHGHVNPAPAVARCGGPSICGECWAERQLARLGLAEFILEVLEHWTPDPLEQAIDAIASSKRAREEAELLMYEARQVGHLRVIPGGRS
jgi:hypothetical protein